MQSGAFKALEFDRIVEAVCRLAQTPPGATTLAELQPELFVEVSPQLAQKRGLEHMGWATISTARNSIEAKVMVTQRIMPGHVGLPYHWGWKGLVKGDVVNDLFSLALDANVHIQEVKAATCDIRPGRR